MRIEEYIALQERRSGEMDNDIIKALECCVKSTSDCENCPLYIPGDGDCVDFVKTRALAIINRLQAENERLESLSNRLCDDVDLKLKYIYELEEKLKTAKSEAGKEFAERLINEKSWQGMWRISACVDVDDIDNLLEEMEKNNDKT